MKATKIEKDAVEKIFLANGDYFGLKTIDIGEGVLFEAEDGQDIKKTIQNVRSYIIRLRKDTGKSFKTKKNGNGFAVARIK